MDLTLYCAKCVPKLMFSENRLKSEADNYLYILEGNGAPGKKFNAYLKRQFVTEFMNINRLTHHQMWSTIKTLLATVPEPSSMDRRPRTGVTEGVSLSGLESF